MTRLQATILAGCISLAYGAAAAPIDVTKLPPDSTKANISFDTDIEPLFKASCLRCHGEEKPRGGIRLDSMEGVLKGGKDGLIVKPGDSASSQLVISISQLDPKTAMPPKRRPRKQGGQGGPGGPGGQGGAGGPDAAGGPGGPPPGGPSAGGPPPGGPDGGAGGPPPGGQGGGPGTAGGPQGGPGPGPGGPNGQRPQGPPPKPLTPEQVGLVRAWIDQGAK
jgi:hypothetical protein